MGLAGAADSAGDDMGDTAGHDAGESAGDSAYPAPVWDHPQPFLMPVMPRTDDIDALAHTNNAVYVRWCADIGWAHSEALGLTLADYCRLDRAMVIRHADYAYLRPTVLHDDLVLATWLLADGARATTINRVFQLVRRHDAAMVLRGRWNLACIELSSGRPRRLPPEFVAAYVEAAGRQTAA